MMISPESVSSLWTLSTEHVSFETFDDLEKKFSDPTKVTGELVSYRHDYGWFISVPPENVLHHFSELNSFPQDLLTIFRIAVQNKISWISLDSDGGLQAFLPTFDR